MTEKITCISPIDGSVVAERPVLDAAAAAAAAARASKAQQAWAARPLQQRADCVMAAVDALEAVNEEIVPELARMMGRPVRFGGEIGGVRERAEHMANIAEAALAAEIVEDSTAFQRRIERVPLGVVLVIAPWNYPYLTAINTIAPALIAGNAVLLKHASQTLLAGERLADAFHAAGVPEDVFQNLPLDHAGTEGLIRARLVDFVNFTGSVAGGRVMEQAAAGNFIPLGLELGGKDPGYVSEKADLDAAVATLIDGAMFNSGQCCCGIERIYVHKHLHDDFIDRAVSTINELVLGDPLDSATTLGPMARPGFANLVRQQTAAAIAAGATAHIDRFDGDDGKAYLSPQLLSGVDHSMALMREENFGPVVGIMAVSDDDEAVRLMNDSPYGLTASVWTDDPDHASAIGRQLQTGTVFMNRADYLDPALCWTGCKDTGRGAALSKLGFLGLTRPQSFHLKRL